MRVKVIYPLHFGDRVVMPGETIDAPTGKAQEYIGNGWAIEVAEERKIKRKVRHASRKNDPEV